MTTLIVSVLVIIVLFQISIFVWFVIKSIEIDRDYDRAISKIYRKKRNERPN